MKKLFVGVISCLLALGCLLSCGGCSLLSQDNSRDSGSNSFSHSDYITPSNTILPTLDIDKAGEALRNKGYVVEIEYDIGEDDDELYVERIVVAKLEARKGHDWIRMTETVKDSTAEIAYQMEMVDMEQHLRLQELQIAYFEDLFENYEVLPNSDFTAVDAFRTELECELMEMKRQYQMLKADVESRTGIKGNIYWIASSVDVIKDTK